MMKLIKNLSEPKNLIIACVGYTVIITIFFLVPISTGTKTDLSLDKIVHILFNATLLFLWLHYLNNIGRLKSWLVILVLFFLAIIYGIIIELLQKYFTTSRMADLWDVVANSIGCICGLVLFKVTSIKYSS